MATDIVQQNNSESPFDAIKRLDASGSEYWMARELMPILGYARWDRVPDVIERAQFACKNSSNPVTEHFSEEARKSQGRTAQDFRLSRYACYLVAMNGDPRKPEIAQEQSYFAIQTYKAERSQGQTGIVRTLDTIRMEAEANIARLRAGQDAIYTQITGIQTEQVEIKEEQAVINARVANTLLLSDGQASTKERSGSARPSG